MTQAKEETLSCIRAVWQAFFYQDISFFPRVEDNRAPGNLRTLTAKEALKTIADQLDALSPNPSALDAELKLARESLDEVTAQTDYQDGKATRLLTIVTFMSAFSGLAFNRLADGYPVSTITWTEHWPSMNSVLVLLSYALFAAFALLATAGALVTFHAIRTRFRYPREAAKYKKPSSMLFWMGISRTQPERWGKAFINPNDPKEISADLKAEYIKNYIAETYLIAAKVADKVRFLEPAQRIQSLAIKALFLWIIVTALVFSFVPPVKKESNSVIRIETPIAAVCVTGGSNVSTTTNGRPCGATH
jgi:hypothetical protein